MRQYIRTCLLACSWLITIGVSVAADSKASDDFFTELRVRKFRIEVPESALSVLKHRENRVYARAKVREGSRELSDVGVRLKGTGSFRPLEEKPSFAVKFDEFVPQQEYCGLSKIMLNNSAQDPTCLAEYAGLEMFRAAGLPTPRVTHALVEFNGRDLGLYVVVEAVNKTFLKERFKSAKGNLYEATFQDIDVELEQDHGESMDQSDRKRLAEATKISDPTERWAALQKTLNVDRFVSFVALELFASLTDGYVLNRSNYRIYRDPGTDQFVFIPHGVDWSFGNPKISIWPPMKSLAVKAVLQTPEGRKLYDGRVGQLLTNVLLSAKFTNALHTAEGKLRGAARTPEETYAFQAGARAMRERVALRIESIRQQLAVGAPEP